MSNITDFIIEDDILTKYIGDGGDVVISDGVTEIGVEHLKDIKNIKCHYSHR